jgi:hypothetical protein
MKVENDEKFIRNVENMVSPEESSYLFFFQRFKSLLPGSLFRNVLYRTSKKTPRIGFVIEPYSFFLFYRLKNVELAESMLPERYELIKSRIFADEEPDYFMGMGIFNTRASTFQGARLESYLIAKDRETGLVSWIFIDIWSNTLISEPITGISDPNCDPAYITTNSWGDIFIDFKEKKSERRLSLKGKLTGGKLRPLDQPLWVMGNTSIAHRKELTGKNDDPFAVVFDPAEVREALDIPVKDVDVRINNMFPDLAEEGLNKVLCFPYAQHYIADSPGCRTFVKDYDNMIEHYNGLSEKKGIKTFSSAIVRKLFFTGIGISGILSLMFIIMMILKM